MLGLRVKLLSDNGAFFADAQPTKSKSGLFSIVTGSYDMPTATIEADGVYTNRAPSGVACRCSFRVTETSYLIERLVQNAVYELNIDPAELRRRNFVGKDQFPYLSTTRWVYDSGDYKGVLDVALEKVNYADLRREQEATRAQGKLMGIFLASFTEVVGAGHGQDFDILGQRMFDSAEPTLSEAAIYARDPVCGMSVDEATAQYRSGDLYFCAPGCLNAYEAHP